MPPGHLSNRITWRGLPSGVIIADGFHSTASAASSQSYAAIKAMAAELEELYAGAAVRGRMIVAMCLRPS